MSNLHFDQYQFARRRPAVAAEYTQAGWSSNGIAFSDYDRMNTVNSSVPLRQRRWTPAFAASDDKLRRVLLHRAWMYLHGSGRPASALGDWKTINDAATKKALERFKTSFQNCPAHKRRESDAHVAAVKQAGSYLALQSALAYHAWRLGKDSVAIGETLGMSPQSVRVNLQRLCDIARNLGYETFPRHYSFGHSHVTIKTAHTDERCDCIIALYKEGKNLSQIAQAIGYPKCHGNNYVREVLLRAGIIYVWLKRKTKLDPVALAAHKAKCEQAAAARKAKHERRARIVAEYAKRRNYKEVATMFGVHWMTVLRAVQRAAAPAN